MVAIGWYTVVSFVASTRMIWGSIFPGDNSIVLCSKTKIDVVLR